MYFTELIAENYNWGLYLQMWRNSVSKLERDIASDIWGLHEIIQLLLNFIKLYNSDLIALNKFVKNVIVDSRSII